MSALTISLASICEKADGSNKQENLWICPDLVRPGTAAANDDTLYSLSSYGALMVVASPATTDYKGVKASEIVTNAIYRHFRFIPSRATRNDNGIRGFLGDSISAAANALNDFAQAHPEYDGTSIDVVVAWLINGRMHLAWTGDTYAYVFNPANGLARLTHDYSDTPGTPEINIHTYPVHTNDIFMVCSNDVALTLSPHILESIMVKQTYLVPTLDELWNALLAQGGVNDATIALLRIDSASTPAPPVPQGWNALYDTTPQPLYYPEEEDEGEILPADDDEELYITEIVDEEGGDGDDDDDDTGRSKLLALLWAVLGAAIVFIIFGIFYFTNIFQSPHYDGETDSTFCIDSISWLAVEQEVVDTTKAPVDTTGVEKPDTLKAEKPEKKSSSSVDYTPSQSIIDYYEESTPEPAPQPAPAPNTLAPHANFNPDNGDPGK